MKNRLRRAIWCIAFLLAVSGWAIQTAPAQTGCSELRVMTFNIRYGTAADGEDHWSKRRDQVFELLGRHQPTVIGLQEALRFQIDEILAALPSYSSIGVGRDDGKTAGEHAAILYRTDRLMIERQANFWFSDTPEVPGSKHWGNQITRMCTWARFVDRVSGKAVYVYNLHLDHISQPSRERSARLLLEQIRSRDYQDPVVVTGDFNAGESNPAVRALTSDTMRFMDSFRMLYADATDVGTFNGFKGNRAGEKIDYVLVTPSIQVKEAAIVRDSREGRMPSDHFPVTAVVCF